jgi:hypothetical protein
MSTYVEDAHHTEGDAPTETHDDAPTDGDAPEAPPTRKPLGQLAVDAGLVTPQQLASAFTDITSTGKRLGEVLVAREWIDQHQLDQLLAQQARMAPAPEGEEPPRDPWDAQGAAGEARAESARGLDDLLAEVERRAAHISRRAGREVELEARLSESEALLRGRDDDLAIAREEVERLKQQLAERAEYDAAIRATLERVTQQLTERDPEG